MRCFYLCCGAMVLFTSLACSGWPTLPARSDACGVRLDVPLYLDRTSDLLDDEDAIQLRHDLEELYLTVQCLPKQDYDEPWSMLTSLDRFIDEERTTPPDGVSRPNEVEAFELSGFPAVSRFTWQTLDSGADIASWNAVVDLPDRRVFVETWTLLERQQQLDDLIEVARSLRIDEPPRGQRWQTFPEVTPAPQLGKPPSEVRLDVGAEFAHSRTVADRAGIDDWKAITWKGPLGDMKGWVRPAPSGQQRPAMLVLSAQPSDLVDEQEQAFLGPLLAEDITLFVPTLRGRHGNPGTVERLWGEVDDVIAALDHLSAMPAVDPAHITMLGSYQRGTLAMLAAAERKAFERVVVLSSPVDLVSLHERYPSGYDPTEYVPSPDAHRARSPLYYASLLQSPVVYFWGERSFATEGPFRMERAAMSAQAPFELVMLSEARAEDLPQPIMRWMAARIRDGRMGEPVSHPERIQLELEVLATISERVGAEVDEWMEQSAHTGVESLERFVEEAAGRGWDSMGPRGARAMRARAQAHLDKALAEQAEWPELLDTDRMDRAFAGLREQGVLVFPNFEDCSDCAWAAIKHSLIDREREGHPTLGFVTWTEGAQQRFVESGTVMIQYGGWNSATRDIGSLLVQALSSEGLEPSWDGDPDVKVELSMDARRRLPQPSSKRGLIPGVE